jgi:tRNA G18 (ribose-2'-O)-methylase SpoU
MQTPQPIDSLDAPELLPYRTMKRDGEHRKQRIFVAEGDKVVVRLLESSFGVVSLLMPPAWVEKLAPLIARRPDSEAIRIFTAERKLLEQLTGFSMYQGVLGVGRVPEPVAIPSLLQDSPRPLLFVAVEDLTNAENLGGLVRNCVAFGVTALLVGESCSSPYLRRAVRASMGTVFKLPVVETKNLGHTLLELRSQGVACLAAHPHTDRCWLHQSDVSYDCCLLFGHEGLGLTETLLDLCDRAVAIPMAPGVDSLNVVNAAAIFLYEAARQQGRLPPSP